MARYNSVNSISSIAGGLTLSTPASGLLTTITSGGNTTVPNPVLYAGTTQVFYNASGSTVSLISPSGNFVGPASSGTGTISLVNGNIITITSDGTNYIVNDFQGGPLSGTTLTASSTVTLNPANTTVTISPSGSGTVIINPATASSMDNVNIGATTKGTGAFTSLTTTGATTLTSAGAASAYNTSGASLLVSGGVGIAGALFTNSTASFGGNVSITNSGTLAVPGVTTISNNTAVTLGTAASGALQVTGGVGIGGAVFSAGEARHDGKVSFGAGNAYLNSSAGDNFTLSTKTNTPNPNFNINIGDGTASGYTRNPIFWNGFLAFSGNNKADASPDVKIDASGNVFMYATGTLQLPKGTTAQRPTGVSGMTRFNTTTSVLEYYNGTVWNGIGIKDGSSSGNAANSAAQIKSLLGNPPSGIYYLQVSGVNSGSPFQCWCDFTINGGIGYAIISNTLFTGSQEGPSFASMSQTTITGTVDKFSNHSIAPTTMMANYNNGAGITKLAVFASSNNGTTSGGIQSSTTYRWVAFTGPTVANFQAIWTNGYATNQFTGSFVTADGNTGTAYFPNNHGSSGGVTQVSNGGTINDSILYEYKPNGGSDPNHYWEVHNGRAGDSYFAVNSLYQGTLNTRWGGVAIY
jgi:hypothetical protein